MSTEPPEKRRKQEGVYADTNAMPRSMGRVLHLDLADGELAQRVICVGHPKRAELLAQMLEPEEPGGRVFFHSSDRGFITYTGLFAGERISVVSIGMGLAMVDFFVREGRAVVEGPMAIVRFGTCGCLKPAIGVGGIAVASSGSVLVQRNCDTFSMDMDRKGDTDSYAISSICPANTLLSSAVLQSLQKELGTELVHAGLNATADSFYCSQGRIDSNFADHNQELIDNLLKQHPDIVSMEMETFGLLHLAHCCRSTGRMQAAAAAVLVANRCTGDVVDGDKLKSAEVNGGRAILGALARFTLGE